MKQESLLVALNGSVSFALLKRIFDGKTAKVIPSVTAEVNRSQTLVCFNRQVNEDDRQHMKGLLECFGEMIELPENEIAMGSELVSCMPGFIASVFDVICRSAKKHTEIPYDRVVQMVLNTMTATGELMLKNDLSFSDRIVFFTTISNDITISDDVQSFLIETRFEDERSCIYCDGMHVVKNGKRRDGVQRYLCRECHRTFIPSSDSITSRTRKSISVWAAYLKCMMDQKTLKQTSDECHISISTAFTWRHKILDALRKLVS